MNKLLIFSVVIFFITACLAPHDRTGSKPSQPSNSRNNPSLQTISLQLTTHLGDKQQFVEGDEIQFLISLDKDAYLYMFYIDAMSKISQILPNKNQQDNYYAAGYYQAVPDRERTYRFIISPPFGREVIWVIASDRLINSADLSKENTSIDNIRKLINQHSSDLYGEYAYNIVSRKK